MNQRKTSQRFWHFEDVLSESPGFAPLRSGPLSILCLQIYSDLVWKHEGGSGPPPVVKPRRKNDESLFIGATRSGEPATIQLCPGHRNLWGLLHELAHALGPNDKLDHGPAFRRRVMRLYRFYGGWDGEIGFDRAKNDY